MISENYDWFRFFVTDKNFGPVTVGDETFLPRFQRTFGLTPKHLAWMSQVHSPTVRIVEKLSSPSVIFPETDGLMAREKGVLLITKTADCVPILLWNEQEKIIAALHCGWRGFFRGILESFQKLCQEQGFELWHFSAFLGPHLRVKHFEVGKDFIQQIPDDKRKFLVQEKNQTRYDLTNAVISTFRSMGIKDLQISPISTYNSRDYFSYRKWLKQPKTSRTENYSTFASCIIILP